MPDNEQMTNFIFAMFDVLDSSKYGNGRMAREERAKALAAAGEAFDAMVDARVRELLKEVERTADPRV